MATFKVGDKVRCTSPGGTALNRRDTYEVVETRSCFGERFIRVEGISGFWDADRFKPAPAAKAPKVKPEAAPADNVEAPKPGIPMRFVVVAEDGIRSLHVGHPGSALRGAKVHTTRASAVERAKELSAQRGGAFAVLQVIAEVTSEHVPATTKTVVKEI